VISYTLDASGIGPEQLHGFFRGWPKAPSTETHLRLLKGSDRAVVAVDGETRRVVGFTTAITDGVLAAYVPFLEVLPEYRGRGIARELVGRLRETLRGYYMIDLVCDPELQPFYEALGFTRASAMVVRDREHQSGRVSEDGGARRAGSSDARGTRSAA
jgi:ribosomal protein S18 acetylase RimI-like enzyme